MYVNEVMEPFKSWKPSRILKWSFFVKYWLFEKKVVPF